MNVLFKPPRLARPGWLACFFLFASILLPSVGVTTTASRVLLGIENQTAAEEHEERLPCSAVQRVRPRRTPHGELAAKRLPSTPGSTRHEVSWKIPVIGHRFSNGLLAPIRC